MGAERRGWQEALGSEGATPSRPEKWALCQKNDQWTVREARESGPKQNTDRTRKTGTPHPHLPTPGKEKQVQRPAFKIDAASLQPETCAQSRFVGGRLSST